MNTPEARNARRRGVSFREIVKVCRGDVSKYLTASAERNADRSPGPTPPNHALRMTAQKNRAFGVGWNVWPRSTTANVAVPTDKTATTQRNASLPFVAEQLLKNNRREGGIGTALAMMKLMKSDGHTCIRFALFR